MRAAAAVFSLVFLSGCAALTPGASVHPSFYALAGAPGSAQAPRASRASSAGAPTLVVSPPHAAAGFDSQRIMYVRKPDQLEYFAYSEWVDTPARMLGPLIVAAVEASGAFRAVVQTPSPAGGDLRLDTQITRLQQDFLVKPSQVRFALRAYLVDSSTRRVIASREFESSMPSGSEDAHGGVIAAGLAVQAVLEQLAAFAA